jgi:hypothetical protein
MDVPYSARFAPKRALKLPLAKTALIGLADSGCLIDFASDVKPLEPHGSTITATATATAASMAKAPLR